MERRSSPIKYVAHPDYPVGHLRRFIHLGGCGQKQSRDCVSQYMQYHENGGSNEIRANFDKEVGA